MKGTIVDDLLHLEYMFDDFAVHRKKVCGAINEPTVPVENRLQLAEEKLMRLLMDAQDQHICRSILTQVRQALQYCSQKILRNPILVTGNPVDLQKSHNNSQALLQFQSYIEQRYCNLLEEDDIVAPLIVMERIRYYRSKLQRFANDVDSNVPYSSWKSLLEYLSFNGKQLFKICYREIWERDELLERLSLIISLPIELKYFSRIDASLILSNYTDSAYRVTLLSHLSNLLNPHKYCEQIGYVAEDLHQMGFVLSGITKHPPIGRENFLFRSVKQLLKHAKQKKLGSKSQDEAINQELSGNTAREKPHRSPQKILCNLSADQLALILRSIDDTRLLTAKSLSSVFNTIVPYLSTPSKKDLSANSVRSKSYDPEDSDRGKVIRILENMITAIKGY